MKLPLLTALLFVTLSSMAPAQPIAIHDPLALPTTRAAAEPNKESGGLCIGMSAKDCFTSLHRVLIIDKLDDPLVKLPNETKFDVLGHPVTGPDEYFFTARFFGSKLDDFYTYHVRLTEAGTVYSIEIHLKIDPSRADTADEYARTKIGELASLFLPTGCVQRDPVEFYKFFQSMVKPKIESAPSEVFASGGEASDLNRRDSYDIPLCGINVRYQAQAGTATWAVDEKHLSGSVNDSTLIFDNAKR